MHPRLSTIGAVGPEEYHFVNQGECYDLRRVEDEDEFEKTKAALAVSSVFLLHSPKCYHPPVH